MKRKLSFFIALVLILLTLNIPVFADDIPIGTDIGDILATDIVAKINGYVIPSFNINNSMVIYAKHLNNYGFDVAWNGEKRQVDITLNMDKKFDPIPTEEGSSLPIGTKLGDVLHTDIKTYLGGVEIQSFNINGSTAVYFRDLREFGTVNWDGANRVSSLTTDHPDYTNVEKVYEASEVSKLVSPAVVYIEVYDRYGFVKGSGSGFIIDKSGYVVTNHHVIDGAYSIAVKLIDGRVYEVQDILQYNKLRDVAVLKIDGTDLPIVKLGDSDKVESGEKILAIGSPIGLENTISDGLISNKNRIIDNQKYFQISAPISPGSSGGALLNYKAEVIGITSATFVEGQNLNLAIPINEVKSYITAALNNISTDSKPEEKIEESVTTSTTNPNYKEIVYSNGDKYIGELKNGMYHGKGTYYWANGMVYDGDWAYGIRNGYGIMTWPEGDRYEGEFVDGYREGYGIYSWPDGESYEGMWRSGMFHGKGTYYFADGTTDSGIWQDNQYIGEKVNAPTNLWLTPVSSDGIWAYWDHIEYAEYYHVYYSYSAKGPFKAIVNGEGNKAEFYPEADYDAYIYNVGPSTKVYIKVTAVIAGEESEFSNVAYTTTYDIIKAPTELWAGAVSSSEIQIGWNKVEGADYYYLYWSESPFGTYRAYVDDYGDPIEFDWDSDYCAEIFNLDPGKTLYFKVKSVRAGEESGYSKYVYATTLKQ